MILYFYYGITCNIIDRLLTTNQHRANGEELLGERIGRNIPKSYRCQAAAREIQRCDVTFRVGHVLDRDLQFFRQRVNPAWKMCANQMPIETKIFIA